jgi:hypothetical protein
MSVDDDDFDPFDLPMDNDPEVEERGSQEAWQQCLKHWRELGQCGEPSDLVLTRAANSGRPGGPPGPLGHAIA